MSKPTQTSLDRFLLRGGSSSSSSSSVDLAKIFGLAEEDMSQIAGDNGAQITAQARDENDGEAPSESFDMQALNKGGADSASKFGSSSDSASKGSSSSRSSESTAESSQSSRSQPYSVKQTPKPAGKSGYSSFHIRKK